MKKIFSLAILFAAFFGTTANAGLKIGDEFVFDGRTYTVTGENIITNPSFDNGVTGWTGGAGGTISPVTAYTTGGVDGGAYVNLTANGGNGSNNSIGTGWKIEANKTYVFDHYIKKMSETTASREGYIVTSFANAVGTAETKVIRTDTVEPSPTWTLNRTVFTNTVPYGYIQYRARWLNGRFGFDDFVLAEVQEKADNSFLQALITECEEMSGGKESAAFDAAIAAAKEKLNVNDAKVLNAALAELQERLLDYRIANADEGYVVDVTNRFVKNAQFTDLLTNWTCGNIAVGNGINPIIYSHFGAATREMELQNGTTAVSDNYCVQTISKLPKGYYRFGANLVAWNDASNTDSIHGVYLTCNGALTSVSTHGAAGTNPKKFFVEGVVTDSVVEIGLRVIGTNATKIYMDNVSLEYMGFNAAVYITSLRDQIKKYIVTNGKDLLPGVADELKKAVTASETSSEDPDTLSVYYERLDKAYKNATKSISMVAAIQTSMTELQNFLITYSEWPGFNACQAVLAAANGLVTSGPTDIETSRYADIVAMQAALVQAKKDYIMSQNATTAAPADYTMLVKYPSFRVGADNVETATRSSEGWSTANVTNGGDYRTSFNQNKTCFNSWSSDFTSMNLYQDIVGLPAGVYTVSCSAITQAEDVNDQHAYIKSSLTTAVSPNLSAGNWFDATSYPSASGEWEKLTTRKVILLAGDTLRIGFASTHNAAAVNTNGTARGQNGWFSVSDFELKYYGTEGTDAIVNADVQNTSDLKAGMKLAGDKSKVTEYLTAANSALSSNAGMKKVYESLNAATTLATTSVTAQSNFLAANYAKVNGAAQADTLDANLDAIYTAASGLVADSMALANATYTNLASLNTKLGAYLTYATPYKTATTFLGTATPNKYTQILQNVLAIQKKAMSANLVTPEEVTAYASTINTAINDVKVSYVLTGGNNQDLTTLIVNQPLAATSGTVAPEGWTVSGAKDATTKVGQYIDDSATKRYFDTYASGKGILFAASQKMKLPNGTYTVSALVRTPAEGVFIYANGDKLYKTEAPLRTYDKLLRNSTGVADSTGQVSDTYGPIWEAAAEGSAIKLANSGKGRGWGEVLVDDVVVNNHELTIGFSSDSTFTGKPFTGTWFSVVDFKLTLKTLADNTGWEISPVVSPVQNAAIVRTEYFTLSGVRMPTLAKGFNIVKTTFEDGTVKVSKVFLQ